MKTMKELANSIGATYETLRYHLINDMVKVYPMRVGYKLMFTAEECKQIEAYWQEWLASRPRNGGVPSYRTRTPKRMPTKPRFQINQPEAK